MKSRRLQSLPALVLLFSLFSGVAAHGQITPSGDAYTDSATPAKNYGAATLLDVDGATDTAYVQFNLASIPSGASVSQATLKLYVNAVATAGSFNVDYVNGTWSESTITSSLAPALGSAIASNVSITTADKNQYILINITPAVEAWLDGSQGNDGIALVATGAFNASFDSKENTTTSHPAELDIVFAGAGGSGAVSSVFGRTGSVTAERADYSAYYPLLSGANTFTGNQTVKGNLSATGVVTGSSFQIGSNLFAFGSHSDGNVFLGFAGNTKTTGGENTAIGIGTLASNTSGGENTAVGSGALVSNTTGSGNTASGSNALLNNSTGEVNTAVGGDTLASNTTGSENTASGSYALGGNTTGFENTASGFAALGGNTTGSDNTAVGYFALRSSTGNYNTASGANALDSNTTGGGNTASGSYALGGNTTGGGNTACGEDALQNNTTGNSNTALGVNAGPDPTTPTLTNSTAIGAYADVTQSNALVLGSTAAQNGTANVSVGIDMSSPSNILTVLQGGGHAIADGWDTYSSRRWKTNIHRLHGALGKVEQLRGVSYDLKDSGKHEVGVIAEEVGAVLPEVVTYEDNGKDARGVDYSRLTALLIEATKEQQALIRKQQAQIAQLISQVKTIRASLKTIGQTGSEVRTVQTGVSMVHQ